MPWLWVISLSPHLLFIVSYHNEHTHFCREMCNIVNTRFLRPFGVITEITTKSPQKLYNGSFFGPFFTQKSFFSPLKSFWPQVLKTRFHLCNHWRGGARKECQRQYMSTWMLVKLMKIYKYLDEGSLEFFGTDSTNRHQVEPGISWLGNGVICIIYNSPTTMNIRTVVAKCVIS